MNRSTPDETIAHAVVCTDDDALRRALLAVLSEAGVEVIGEVSRGIEVIPLLAHFGTSIVLLDIAAVGTLGLRLIPVLQAAAPGTKVIAITGLETIDVTVAEAGADGVVTRHDLRDLRALVEDAARPVSR
jgi:DNA-binding response OmpR family regulator